MRPCCDVRAEKSPVLPVSPSSFIRCGRQNSTDSCPLSPILILPELKLELVLSTVTPLAVADFKYGVVTKKGLTVTGIETSFVPVIEWRTNTSFARTTLKTSAAV